MSQALNQNFEALFSKMETVLTTKTVVGDPVQFGGVVVVPLVDVTFGVGAGGGGGEKTGGGGGIGGKISPSAVLVIVNDTVQLVNIKNQDSVNKLIDMVPGVMSKLGGLFNRGKSGETETGKDGVKVDE